MDQVSRFNQRVHVEATLQASTVSPKPADLVPEKNEFGTNRKARRADKAKQRKASKLLARARKQEAR
jgi:hypothetical protein